MLGIPCELVKISGDFPTIIQELATGSREWWISLRYHKERMSCEQGRISGEFTENKNNLLVSASVIYYGELSWRKLKSGEYQRQF